MPVAVDTSNLAALLMKIEKCSLALRIRQGVPVPLNWIDDALSERCGCIIAVPHSDTSKAIRSCNSFPPAFHPFPLSRPVFVSSHFCAQKHSLKQINTLRIVSF